MNNREEIVVNGCSGGCCENFSFQLSLSELDEMIHDLDTVNPMNYRNHVFVKDNGHRMSLINDNEIKQIRDMLIPLPDLLVNPNNHHFTLSEKFRYDSNIPDDEEITITKPQADMWRWHDLKDGEIIMRAFTCKHFDTVNRICTNYDNRPNMCRHYGDNCSYEGCGFVKKYQCGVEKVLETLKNTELENQEKKLN